MRIAAYVRPRSATREGTGVAKHIVQMIGGLADTPGVDLRLLVSRGELTADGRIDPNSPLGRLPAVGLPLARRTRELLWNLFGRPHADRWADVDWVYCPVETYVPVRRARLAATVHSLMWFDRGLEAYHSWKYRRLRAKWQLLVGPIVRHAHRILCVSDYLADEYVRELGADRRKLVTVGNGVEDECFGPVTGGPPVPPPYVASVSGLMYVKGGDYLLDVAEQLARVAPGVRLVVAGFDEPRYQLRAKTMANVVLLGFEKAETIRRLLVHSVALLCLSRYESFGIPLAEAMAVGTPCLYAPRGAIPEVAGGTGLPVVPDAPVQTAGLIRDLARDGRMREELAAAGRLRAERFRWSACVARALAAMA